MSIKRIIFDLDNTLIDWKEEYWNTVKETFMELHLQCNDETVNRVKCAVDMYEDGIRMTYNKQLMKEAIEKTVAKLKVNFEASATFNVDEQVSVLHKYFY